jgi:hypothetical protein
MKKIIIYWICLIFPSFVYADFDMKLCENDFYNTCPSYQILLKKKWIIQSMSRKWNLPNVITVFTN